MAKGWDWSLGSVAIATVGALVGCTGDTRVIVRDLATAGRDLSIRVELEAGRLDVALVVPGADCVVLDGSFTGSLTAAAPPQVSRGADSGPDFFCPDPGLIFTTVPAVAPATLRLADATRTVDVALGDLFLPRAAALTLPADGVVSPGDELVIDWTPATDVTARSSLPAFSVSEHSFVTFESAPALIAPRGAQVVATAPASDRIPPGNGEVVIVYIGAPGDIPVDPCPGAGCTISFRHIARWDATFGP